MLTDQQHLDVSVFLQVHFPDLHPHGHFAAEQQDFLAAAFFGAAFLAATFFEQQDFLAVFFGAAFLATFFMDFLAATFFGAATTFLAILAILDILFYF